MIWDGLIYALAGEGIYKHGLPPYDYVFDHKPFLLYFFYGPLSLPPKTWNPCPALTVCALLVTAAIVRTHYTKARWPVLIIFMTLAAATIENVQYSGNSEVIFAPLQLLAIGLLSQSGAIMWRYSMAGRTRTPSMLASSPKIRPSC